MYAPYFGLTQAPFSIAPDPRLLFMSERHREALAHLLYGLGGGGGFVLLTGEIGTGKTTVCRLFLEQVPPDCNVAYIFNPKLTVTELLQSICDEFGIAVQHRDLLPPTVKDYLDPLNAFLLQAHANGRNNVLIIDEAQNLSSDVLEQLRLLTNLETSERKLLQIILIGQPELRTMLQRPELEQLAQRVIARYHLNALSASETQQYIQHRLEVSGLNRALPFDRGALRRIHALSRGVPRRINLLCDRALLGAFAGNRAVVNRAIVDKAAAEVFDGQKKRELSLWQRSLAVLGLSVAAAAVLVVVIRLVAPAPQPAVGAIAVPLPVPVLPVLAASSPTPLTSASAAAPAAPAATIPLASPALLSSEDAAWRELAEAWKTSPGAWVAGLFGAGRYDDGDDEDRRHGAQQRPALAHVTHLP
ncbi:MAG: AAA family ATPase, partial [Ramlibacter sp.]